MEGDFETKQPVEGSVNSEEGDQLKISVGQLESLEEEENTLEAALNDDGHVKDDAAWGENDEGRLEHAMNAGLLNDDDRSMKGSREFRLRDLAHSSSDEICDAREEDKTIAKEDKGTAIRRKLVAYFISSCNCLRFTYASSTV